MPNRWRRTAEAAVAGALALVHMGCGGEETSIATGGAGGAAGSGGGSVSPECGNGVTDPGEACDGADLGLATSACASLPGFATGTLGCQADCRGFDGSGCSAGATVTVVTSGGAPSCEETDVQRAIDEATSGDTVVMAAGSCSWAGLERNGVPDAPLLIAAKNLVLRGAGVGSTIITRSYPGTSSDNRPTILVEADEPVRVTGFTLESTLSTSDVYGITVFGSGKPWRIDHLTIVGLSATQVSAVGQMPGLVDHVELRDNGGVGVEVDDIESTDDGVPSASVRELRGAFA